jgi:hypothetical protein
MRKPPRTAKQWSAYRAILDCKLAKDTLDGKDHKSHSDRLEYALYCIAGAVSSLAEIHMEEDDK